MGSSGVVVFCALMVTVYGSVPLSEFFPYGFSAGDSSVPKADDNFLSFKEGVTQYTPNCSPLSKPMILPYWADVNTVNGGTVYYRQTTDSQLLRKAQNEIERAFPDLNTQNINWLFVATWDNVAFFGSATPTSSCRGSNARNTFQVALATDGQLSFVMFLYNKIEWTTGTASSGNCNGMGGTPAKAGFDFGDGVKFFNLPESCTAGILNVVTSSNVNQPGKWTFRVDETILDPVLPEITTTLVPSTTPSTTPTTPSTTTSIPSTTPTIPSTTTSIPSTTPTSTTTFIPTTTTSTPRSLRTTRMPVREGDACDPHNCAIVGYCTSYFTCNPKSHRRVEWECSDGLFWNPKKSRTKRRSVRGRRSSLSEYNGSCDVWENLPEELKATYQADEECFPKCHYESVSECSEYYHFQCDGSDSRKVEVLECPMDTRNGKNVPLVWVQERLACDFCYNAMRNRSLNEWETLNRAQNPPREYFNAVDNTKIPCCETYN